MEEKNVGKTIELIHQELEKIGLVIKNPVLQPEGADLNSFSNPTLQFTIEQLVDATNTPLPVLHATLAISNVAELGKIKELMSIDTNRWSIYLEKTNDIEKIIKKTLPYLLKEFNAEFQATNTNGQKPTFSISYDGSWWKTPT